MHAMMNLALEQRINELGPWFQNMRFGEIETAPDHFLGDYPAFKWEAFKHVVPKDLQGRSVLDISCNAGFYALEMKRRNAGRVWASTVIRVISSRPVSPPIISAFDVAFRQMSVYEVSKRGERFDLVLFMGVLYHLRHPLLALDLLYEHVVADLMLFQCLQHGEEPITKLEEDYDFSEWKIFDRSDFPKLFYVEERFAADPTNWFIPNKAAVEAMLRSSGFVIEANPEREVYLCRRGRRPYMVEPPSGIVFPGLH
jgi:tRNA (mo5U34)-methyltransferase